VVCLRHPVHDRGIDAQRLSGLARAARPVRRDRGRQRRALATVLPVDVLHNLFAPLMLEVHVDVRRLTALLADEPLEQHRRACWIDLGHAQRIANRRVRGGATPLHRNSFIAREAHDVVDRQKVWLVLQVGDQRQFVFDLRLDLVGHARRPAAVGANVGFLPQIGLGREAVGYKLVRVLVAQLVQREGTAARDGDGLREGARRVRSRA
jgi:hypothetical protein